MDRGLPDHYGATIRVTLRYAIVMALSGALSGVAFQESSKQLDFAGAPPGLHLEAVLGLALVHGHVLVSAVLLPIAMVGALLLAHRVGGRPLGRRPLLCLTRGYLSAVTATLALMLYKGYHVLVLARMGERDLDAIHDRFFAGLTSLRMGVYGSCHAVMAVVLGAFLVGLWRSLK